MEYSTHREQQKQQEGKWRWMISHKEGKKGADCRLLVREIRRGIPYAPS